MPTRKRESCWWKQQSGNKWIDSITTEETLTEYFSVRPKHGVGVHAHLGYVAVDVPGMSYGSTFSSNDRLQFGGIYQL